MKPKLASETEIEELRKLSTERLIIWILGRSKELGVKLTPEDIVLEGWLINPDKHALRGHRQFPCSRTVLKRVGEMKGKKALLTGSEMQKQYDAEPDEEKSPPILLFKEKFFKFQRDLRQDKDVTYFDVEPAN